MPRQCATSSRPLSRASSQPAAQALDRATSDLGFILLDAEAFARATKKSIDYAVMERTNKAVVIPGAFGWSDIGTWAAVWELSDKDANGNAVSGRGYVLEGSNNFIRSEGGLTTIVGVSNIAVIATRDAVLVIAKDKADKVKILVEMIKNNGESEAGEHREIHRPWGKYLSVDGAVAITSSASRSSPLAFSRFRNIITAPSIGWW